jgi:hypothetical protein
MKPLPLPSNQHALLDARHRGVEALLTVYPASTSLPPAQGARATASPDAARLISRLVLAVNDFESYWQPCTLRIATLSPCSASRFDGNSIRDYVPPVRRAQSPEHLRGRVSGLRARCPDFGRVGAGAMQRAIDLGLAAWGRTVDRPQPSEIGKCVWHERHLRSTALAPRMRSREESHCPTRHRSTDSSRDPTKPQQPLSPGASDTTSKGSLSELSVRSSIRLPTLK